MLYFMLKSNDEHIHCRVTLQMTTARAETPRVTISAQTPPTLSPASSVKAMPRRVRFELSMNCFDLK